MKTSIADLALARYHIAVLIPAYRVAAHVAGVIQSIPAYVRTIIVVDDASPDGSADAVRKAGDPRVTLIRHERNQGVGGAMRTAFAVALERGAQICVKIDGDGQMDAALIGHFCRPIIQGEADFVKGNRFMRGGDAESMPLVRKLGNTGLSFLVKMASGYWRIFDPTNGYFAVRRETVEALNWHWIGADYFFEISLLVVLHSLRSAVRDIPIRARYADEVSSLNPWRILVQFPGTHPAQPVPPHLVRVFPVRLRAGVVAAARRQPGSAVGNGCGGLVLATLGIVGHSSHGRASDDLRSADHGRSANAYPGDGPRHDQRPAGQ